MTRNLLLALLFSVPIGQSSMAQSIEEENRESVHAATSDESESADLERVSKLIREKTNAFRKEEGRKPVEVNSKLADTVKYFASYMARENEYGHTADGKRPSQRAKEHGYDYCLVAENIAYAFDSRGFSTEKLAEEFFNGWKNSPGHRRNMLDPDVTETAVAIARSETGYYYAVQMFGRPKSQQIRFKIENHTQDPVTYSIGDQTFNLAPRVIRTHTRCRSADVKFTWPGENKADATITPENGDRFVVDRQKNHFQVEKK